MKTSTLAFLLPFASLGLGSQPSQQVLGAPSSIHTVDDAILTALDKNSDPVDALLFLHPEQADALAEPRLLRVFGDEGEPRWMTEGDKMRLRREGKGFMDVTEHEEFYDQQVNTLAGKARKLNPVRAFNARVTLADNMM